MCSISRDPRRDECTICTARAPDAVFTVRTYGDTRSPYGPRLVRVAGMSWAQSYHGKLRALAGDEEVLIMIGAAACCATTRVASC